MAEIMEIQLWQLYLCVGISFFAGMFVGGLLILNDYIHGNGSGL